MAAHRRTHQRDCHLGIRVSHRPACQCRQGCLNDQHLLFRPAHQTQLDGCEQPDSRCHRDAHHPASPPLRHQLSAVLCRRAVHPVALQAHLQPSACLGHPPQALGLGMGNGGGIGGCPGGNHTAGVLLFRQHRLLFRTQLVVAIPAATVIIYVSLSLLLSFFLLPGFSLLQSGLAYLLSLTTSATQHALQLIVMLPGACIEGIK